ncbi:phosphoribosylanthranilate isomerase [Aquisalimonas asiatica]|uniref:N-(5'-phosphoribosyl)anthranilate isomerase n=1 Tax=Aquisalimonas asiatica TaxID=406100 RepID=A0A1H8RNP1_9GAMM|nr:phosphoribosylanthranilate isomerase [Aquisalimonas asiatica]SEO68000.1 phosphoribosylanthranilate isomerase [Aquisalimonas asiatica]
MRTRVKICGLTRAEDARSAAHLGADAIGLVFHDASPRGIDVGAARAIRSALPPFVTVTALFMNASGQRVRHVLDGVAVDLLQFHGDEDAAFCESFSRPYIKVVPMAGGADPGTLMASHPNAAGFVLDGHGAGEQGGSGRVFDWSSVPSSPDRPIVLAGGLHPENVAAAVRQARPWAVDVSSGVESAPGIKDARRMASFISEVQGVQDVRVNAAID